ncbi:ATP-binding protein [Elizabethkingia anophelis]|uniref:SMEK domain-containing protein n=1 Tax=Elizabethkingia anophelis TaxID=1117645 RepID=A0AAU8UVI1_9FLAO|nr:ATP-binding protein [Elizabethkingia anophelis]AQX02338.1 hypothetical protein BBD32_13150 [Elizabethkingia anophelis]
MLNSEAEFLRIRGYLTKWVTSVTLANASGYFDINRVSEGFALVLLNLIFDAELVDLNSEKNNYPGVDLGDSQKAMFAFQITSQVDNKKILDSLNIFCTKSYIDSFPKGIKFLIINKKKRINRRIKAFEKYQHIFDPEKDIFYPEDLMNLIYQLYYQDETRFYKVMEFLKREFESKDDKRKTIVALDSPQVKVSFYKRLLKGTYQSSTNVFVSFKCKLNAKEVLTSELKDVVEKNDGLIILGPSGCGKSYLARKIAIDFLDFGIPVILEAKYYETDLNALFEKEISVLGFSSGSDFFEAVTNLKLPILFIVDGFNECDQIKKVKLILELENVKITRGIKILLTSQKYDMLFSSLKLLELNVDYPSIETKKAIAYLNSGKPVNSKLEPIIHLVSTSLEAKMIGEIAMESIEKVSRFTLFEIFIREKFGIEMKDGFFLLAKIAQILSDNITFSAPERAIEEILREHRISQSAYDMCFENKILERRLNIVSFTHEMFLNFFIAESIVRFSNDSKFLTQFWLPKNSDKRLLLIGAINDIKMLDIIMNDICDVFLLNTLMNGEGGEYCKKWIEDKLFVVIKKIEAENEKIELELVSDELSPVSIVESTLMEWTAQEIAFLRLISHRLVHGQFLTEFFNLIEKLDDRQKIIVERLKEEGRQKKVNVKSETFSTIYCRAFYKEAGITKIVSSLHSGDAIFRNQICFEDNVVQQLLSKNRLSVGQFYFLLQLFRWDKKLKFLYPFVIDVLNHRWTGVPWHLLLEIINKVAYFHETEQQRQEMISALNAIHSQTTNPWLSTEIFEALDAIGGLDEAVDEYIPYVNEELEKLLLDTKSNDNWKKANVIYNCQFDHLYSAAYQSVINNLDTDRKKSFIEMAFLGIDSVFFGTTLLLDAAKQLKEKVCPLILKWIDVPNLRPYPGEALKMFLVSHLILAKYNFPLENRTMASDDLSTKSLLAAAELYYWANRSNLDASEIRKFSTSAEAVLFDPQNVYTIDTIYKFKDHLHQSSLSTIYDNINLKYIEDVWRQEVLKTCGGALQDLDWQKCIGELSFGSDANILAIHLLEAIGGTMDIDVLRTISEHPEYGESAVRALKKILQSQSERE